MGMTESVISILLVAYLGVTGWALKALIDLRGDLQSHMAVEESESHALVERVGAVETSVKDLVVRFDSVISNVFHHPAGAK